MDKTYFCDSYFKTTMDNLSELLHRRRSIRKYKDTAISPDLVSELMKAALMAPSSKRSTPWEFVLVEDKETLIKLSNARKSGSAFVDKAPLVIVMIADTEKTDVWVEDASIAAAYLQLQAEELGLGSCWVQVRSRQTADGEDTDAYIRRLLNIPEKYGVLCMIAVGVKDEEKKPFNEEYLQWEKIHIGAYGNQK